MKGACFFKSRVQLVLCDARFTNVQSKNVSWVSLSKTGCQNGSPSGPLIVQCGPQLSFYPKRTQKTSTH